MSRLTHVHLRINSELVFGKPQERVGTDTPADVLQHIRQETLNEEPPGKVVVLCPYNEVQPRFDEVLRKGEFDPSRVTYLHATPIEKEVSVPAVPAHQSIMRDLTGNNSQVIDFPRKPSCKVKKTFERRLHLGNRRNMFAVREHLKDASMFVIIEPNEWEDDLRHLPDLMKLLPELEVVIYHAPSVKWGVEYEGDGDQDNLWDTQSEVEKEGDLPPVIKSVSHEGESTWVGGLPKVGKTWLLLCIVKALITGEPLFGYDRLTVPRKAKRIIYLCPEAGRGSIKKRLKMLGLIQYLYDPITNPDGVLYLRTLSKGQKIALTDPELLRLTKGADIFIDTAVRYLDGDENAVKDVKVLTENVLGLLSAGARSLWVAHHAPKGFENASSMTLQNMFRGSGEFGAALTNAYGVCTEDAPTTKIRFHCITGRDLDEPIPDMILQGRPYLFETGNFKVIETNAAPFKGKAGAPSDSERQQKIDFAKTVEGSYQDKANAVNEKFDSKHDRGTIAKWLKPFDAPQGAISND